MLDPSAPHIIILLIVVLLLFGSSRLPGAAKSLGRSMHIFKNSVKGLDPDDQTAADGTSFTQATVVPPAQQAGQPAQPAQQWASSPQQLTSPQPDPAHQAQLDDLQRQVAELQRLSANGNGSPVSDSPPTSQSN
jgi:sec-independent protein translocase protein TatA